MVNTKLLNLPKSLSSGEMIVTFIKKKLLNTDAVIHGLMNLSILSKATDYSYTTLCLREEDMQPLIKNFGKVLKHSMIGSQGHHQKENESKVMVYMSFSHI